MKGETTSGNERICKLHTYHSYLNFTLSFFLLLILLGLKDELTLLTGGSYDEHVRRLDTRSLKSDLDT